MRNLVSTYVDQFRQDRQKQLKLAAVLAALAVIVAGVVFWQLHSTGVAMTNEVFCGQEEHIHTEDCYDGETLVCDIPEHIHTVECLMDETADVETADVWEATLPALSDVWPDDVVAIAESQVGYTESTANFILADDGETHMGYTRYGAWYGNVYGDWDAMFVSFCLNYANVPSSVVPENSGAYALSVSLNEDGLYVDTADFTPAAGDLVFFDENGNGQADRVGIIVDNDENELTVIEGNSEDAVAENTYDINDPGILAFGILPDQGTPEGTENIDGDIVYAADDGGVYVSVTAPADALPEGAELSVTLIDDNSADYAGAADAIGLNVQTLSSDEAETGMAVLDICFLLDGREVEPAEPVTVSIDAGAILPDGAENIVIQHLEETDDGIVPVRMAELNAASPVAEFEVESFSAFTVTWTIANGPQAGTTYTVNVTAYLDGTELDGITGLTFNSENDELDFETLLSDVGYGTGDYTFSYAIVTVGNQTYGTQGNPVVAIEIEAGTGGGPTGSSSNFLLVYADGTTETVSTSSTVNVSAYYITPEFSVEIESVDTDEAEDWLLQAVISHAGTYDHVGYEWTITNNDGSSNTYATIGFSDTTGRIFIVWADGVEDNTEITVSVTATIYDADNNVLGTATDSCVLEYGDETVDLIMTYGPDKTPLPADVTVTLTSVTLTDESGEKLVVTGMTDSDGWVHDLEIEPGIYTVTATYTDSEGNTYQCSEEVAFHDAGNYSINLNYYDEDILTNVTTRDNWEHIDIKMSVGTSSSDASNENVSVNITGVVIYDGTTGAAKYTATEESIERNDNEFQCSFYTGDGSTGTASHSISFSTSDTIEINYTLTWTSDDDPTYERTEEFTITIDSSTTYGEGTTYPATGQRAYKLYNYLYGTSYSSDAQLVADGIDEVDISGMSMMLVASILCDSSEVTGAGTVVAAQENQWGMDFAVSIDTFIELSTNWTFNIEKTYENHAMNAGDFTFYMYSANCDDEGYWHIETEDENGWHYTLSNSTAGRGTDGNSTDTIENVYITFDDEMVTRNATHYYIICENTTRSLENTTYDGTVFGAAVYVGVNETTGEPVVQTTYYILTLNDDGMTYTATLYEGNKITFDSDENEDPTFHFTNIYQTSVEIHKQDMYDGDLDDAKFTLTQRVIVDYDEYDEPIYGYYYYYDHELNPENPEDSVWVSYNPNDPDFDPEEIPSFTLGTLQLDTPFDGEYTFTEVDAPAGYEKLPGAIVVTIENGYLVEVSWAEESLNADYDIKDYVTIDDAKLNLYIKDEDAEFAVSIFKYTGDVIWTSEVAAGGGAPMDTNEYYLRYTDDDGNYWYALVGTGTGEFDDPFVVTGWTEEQANAWSTRVYAAEGGQYYFTGKIGNVNVYFETEDPPTGEEDDPIELVEGTYEELAGAEFTVQNSSNQYAYFTIEKDSDGNDVYILAGWYTLGNGETLSDNLLHDTDIYPEGATFYLTSGEDGYVYIEGMTYGTYTLTETKAPDGFILLTESIPFTVEPDGEIDSEIVVGNSVGVVNNPSPELPMTGGFGTWTFTAAGLLLIGGATSLLVYRKRRAVRS